MSYYNQGSFGSRHQSQGSNGGLQFLPTQFDTTAPGLSQPQVMSSQPSVSNAYGYSEAREPLSVGILAAFGTQGYPDEPPLLEELGFNFQHIKQKTLTVLNPLRQIDKNIMDDSDLAGPILFCLLFGTFLLLSGKVHFGYIYGAALIGTLSLYGLFNLMSLNTSIDFIRVASVLGYCLLPLVGNSALAVVISMDNTIGYIISAFAIFWCTYSSSAIFVTVLQLSEMRVLVAYPLALFYGVFSIMTIFAENVTKK